MATPFGDLLKLFRTRQKLTQLQLAEAAQTTARHLSFLENGRSRPKSAMVKRLADALELNAREHNALLVAAGLPTNHIEFKENHQQNHFLQQTIERQMQLHEPYPACVVDIHSRIRFANQPFLALFADLIEDSAENSIDAFFGNERTREVISNWDQIAQAFFQRRQYEASRTGNSQLHELSVRTKEHLLAAAAAPESAANQQDSMVLFPEIKVGTETISLYMTVLRFESIQQCALSDLRLELFYPVDEQQKQTYLRLLQKLLEQNASAKA